MQIKNKSITKEERYKIRTYLFWKSMMSKELKVFQSLISNNIKHDKKTYQFNEEGD